MALTTRMVTSRRRRCLRAVTALLWVTALVASLGGLEVAAGGSSKKAAAERPVLPVLQSVDELQAIESSHRTHAIVLLSSKEHGKKDKADKADAKGEETTDEAVDLGAVAYELLPSFERVVKDLDGAISFAVADVAADAGFLKKWGLTAFPAIVVYAEEPKANPYTGKLYRQSSIVNIAMLDHMTKFKKLLKDSVVSTHVEELTAAQTKPAGFGKLVAATKEDGEKVVVLISKNKKASHLYRGLANEFCDQGLRFVYWYTEDVKQELLQSFGVESIPALLVVSSMDEVKSLDEKKMTTYAGLKAFVQQFATQLSDEAKQKKQEQRQGSGQPDDPAGRKLSFFNSDDIEKQVLKSKLVWIMEFMDAEQEAAFSEAKWKKIVNDLQKKVGIVAFGMVSCEQEAALCEKYEGPGFRVFPIDLDPATRSIQRDLDNPVLPRVFKTFESAKDAAAASLPDIVQVITSSTELNNFVSLALQAKALPTVLFTKKAETPAMLKSLSMSFPTQKVMCGVVYDASAEVKGQFSIPASANTAMVSLVPVAHDPSHPEGAAPFGIILYDKKTMGPYNYQNMMRYISSVLVQHPHPNDDVLDGEASETVGADSEASSSVVYLRNDNIKEACSGSNICAIAFFEQHIDTLSDDQSPLNKSLEVLSAVAQKSKKAKEPYRFMWTNGKCQSAFAEAFGVGLYQMPTVVVYAPSKGRYALNVGLFNEENTHGFLKGVLSGRIPTVPIDRVPDLVDECSFESIQTEVADVEDEDDEALGDLLSEIMDEEQKQRDLLEEQLKENEKSSKKSAKKKKKGKKGKKKGGAKDEL